MSNHLSGLDDFREVVLLDAEFIAIAGERVIPVCLVAHELSSGRCHRIFFPEVGGYYGNPLPTGDEVLYVAYSNSAEWSTFLALGWDLPVHCIDLFAEFRSLTNGLLQRDGSPVETSLLAAMEYFGLDSMAVAEKDAMRNLILRGHPYSTTEIAAILDYCEKDVQALENLLPVMMPNMDLPFAIFRGRYSKAVARMAYSGIPIDTQVLTKLCRHWDELKLNLTDEVENTYGYGVYRGTHWSEKYFVALLERMGILDQWPRVCHKNGAFSDRLSLNDEDTFKEMALRFPELAPLRDLRILLTRLREFNLPVGADGRNRFHIAPFRSVTGRNYPPTSQFVFGMPTWVRSLVKPEKGRAIAYLDWSSAEFGIAAALSGDTRMQEAYRSGDVYLAFAIMAGAAPPDATKHSHADVRELYKKVVLGVQYGQSEQGLAKGLGVPLWRAQELLGLHKRIFFRYWKWSEWIHQKAIFSRSMETIFRWQMHITSKTKPRTITNFPMQANGAELLRWACCFTTEAGVEVHAPVQDALLIGGPADSIDKVVEKAKQAMNRACELVLGGFILRTDAKIVKYPNRYIDERGATLWDCIMRLLNEIESSC